ncbi:MAG: ABC transporter ATP-binding protein [Candidatus Nomurabacteria bacterium]|nr:MAG: ABC transporter ATP-binding protein [Candidatus Nomurabacteria bacterium]
MLASSIYVSTSYVFKLIIDAVENGDIDKVILWGLVFPVILFVFQALYRLSGYFAGYWINNTVKSTSDDLTKYILHHSHGYYVNRFAGSVTNKVRNVVNAIDQMLPDILWGHLSFLVSFLVTFVLIMKVDLLSSMLLVLLIIVLFFVNRKLSVKKTLLSKIYADSNTALQGRLVDVITNVNTMRQYTQSNFEIGGLEKLTEHKQKSGINSFHYTEILLISNVFVLFLFSIGIFWILVNKWALGSISTGDFILSLSLILNISGSLVFIGRAFNATARMVGELKEGLDDLLIDYEIVDDIDAKPLKIDKGEIVWNKVNFKFDDNDVFSNFNLEIPASQRVGLVGSSGAGKTTFVSLLLRQHDIDGGEILIDGQDISKVTQDSLRQAIAVVPQEPALFHRTIRENIAYGRLEASDEKIIQAAKQAHAHEFIEKLPQGYDTLVGERGVKLSGGQKQRVAIARAILKDAPILILDEATSALDSESETLIQEALHELMKNKTVIAIAHRLSTLREMDRIIVLENGAVIEDGDHNKLRQSGGIYEKLWNHQSGGFVQDN